MAVVVLGDDGQIPVVEADLNPLTAPTLADLELTPGRWCGFTPLCGLQ